ncbi:ribonuclease P protein component [Fonticella tunisiensis]|uniref:Ribonuclease P protein component n=1 Tax=Fonticella tunisiensis TaxID=1096341 RepID=A0A4R7KCT2_9CLOT|nr:ribonuclease P protein component [Fonticella tunisiensis]TDT50496.1 ribonuclease P protein component [Fonticella tunisiensis]
MKTVEKIKKNSQFKYIYNRGKSISDPNLVLYIVRNNKNVIRLGITVSKKVGKAVVRNRIKRLIRESFRLNKNKFKYGYDLIFVARSQARKCTYRDMEKSVLFLMKKGDLLKESE